MNGDCDAARGTSGAASGDTGDCRAAHETTTGRRLQRREAQTPVGSCRRAAEVGYCDLAIIDNARTRRGMQTKTAQSKRIRVQLTEELGGFLNTQRVPRGRKQSRRTAASAAFSREICTGRARGIERERERERGRGVLSAGNRTRLQLSRAGCDLSSSPR